MTHRLDVASGREIIARWCILAEQRLEHLTELFETGRWRRYHTERAFLENIQEAKAAVAVWRDMVMREASRDNSAIDISWLGHRTAPRLCERLRDQTDRAQPPTLAARPARSEVLTAAKIDQVSPAEGSAPMMDITAEPILDIDAIERRYPLLRNAL